MKVIIIGGGIAGLTCARACLDAGMEVEVYEKRDLESMLFGAGGIFIQQNAMRVYEILGEGKIRESLYAQGAKILKGGFFSKKAEFLYLNSPNFANFEDLGICLLRNSIYRLTPTWLGDLQFKWLFDYQPKLPELTQITN